MLPAALWVLERAAAQIEFDVRSDHMLLSAAPAQQTRPEGLEQAPGRETPDSYHSSEEEFLLFFRNCCLRRRIALQEIEYQLLQSRTDEGGSVSLQHSQALLQDTEKRARQHIRKANAALDLLTAFVDDRRDKVKVDAQTQLTMLQIEESRRAIQQAETVRRLTILAFIFIPLSSVTGAFGMNLRELGPDTPAWVFGVSAASVVTATTLLAVGPKAILRALSKCLDVLFYGWDPFVVTRAVMSVVSLVLRVKNSMKVILHRQQGSTVEHSDSERGSETRTDAGSRSEREREMTGIAGSRTPRSQETV